MLTSILNNKDVILNILLKYIEAIALDTVVNVKVTLAKVLSKAIKQESKNKFKIIIDCKWLLENEKTMKIIQILKSDKNRNINVYFEDLHNLNVDLKEKIETNYVFDNIMSILKDEFGILRNLPLNSKLKLNKRVLKSNVNPHDFETHMPLEDNNTLIKKDENLMVVDEDNLKFEKIEDKVDDINNIKTNENIEDINKANNDNSLDVEMKHEENTDNIDLNEDQIKEDEKAESKDFEDKIDEENKIEVTKEMEVNDDFNNREKEIKVISETKEILVNDDLNTKETENKDILETKEDNLKEDTNLTTKDDNLDA